MHHCCNVVVGPDGEASAVLLRAGEVVEGVELARSRRPAAGRDRELARGPGRLCSALAIDLGCNATDLTQGPVTLVLATSPPAGAVRSGPRVGLRLAADVPWRFWLEGEPTVSAYKRSPRASAVTDRRTDLVGATGVDAAGWDEAAGRPSSEKRREGEA
jgi:DNA-3-methyladenine glycosylase